MPGAARQGDAIQGTTAGEHNGHATPHGPLPITGTISGGCSGDVFINGQPAAYVGSTISGDETTAQAVRLTLEVYRGEFPFDPTHGTEYERIMGKKRSELEDDEIPEVIRDAVFQEPQVAEVSAVDYELVGRGLEVSVTGRLQSGNTITTEVSTA